MARLFLFAFTTVVAHAASFNLTSSGCVDTTGFQSCQNAANVKIDACFAGDGGNPELAQVCACEAYVLNYNCYAAHCWNQVWGCEYQEYITTYLLNCPTAKLPVPYFPAPRQAAGACSCSLGDIYQAITNSVSQGASCMKNISSSSSIPYADRLGACGCCEISGAISSLYEICPKTDPELIGLSSIARIETLLDVPFSECQPMTKINCETDLSFSLAGVTTYYPPSGLPPSGTATLTNMPGSVTAPPSGSVFSYTNGADSVVYTITAADAKGAGKASSTTSPAKSRASRGPAAYTAFGIFSVSFAIVASVIMG